MSFYSVALYAAREDELLAGKIATALVASSVSVLYPPHHVGVRLHRLGFQAKERDRLVLLVSRHTFTQENGPLHAVVESFYQKEWDAGGDAFIVPVAVDETYATLKEPLANRVPVLASLPFDDMIARLLRALRK